MGDKGSGYLSKIMRGLYLNCDRTWMTFSVSKKVK